MVSSNLLLQAILNKTSSRRDFSLFGIYFSSICVWELFELIRRVSTYPASFFLCQKASIVCANIFIWFEKYSILARGARARRSAQRNSACAQWGPPKWRWLTVTRKWAITCNDSRIQAKPLNEDSSGPQQLISHRAVIILLVFTSGSYIVFTPDQLHHWFSKMADGLLFKIAAKTGCDYFSLNTWWTRIVH